MAKKTLAVTYRPKAFSEVVEQDAVKSILQYQVETGTFKNAYLLCGPAGCSKTTQARILANAINKGKGLPIEIDAASNSGVENVRNIIDGAHKRALDAEYKVYIVDECFHKNTLIRTPEGYKRIASIKVGDSVYNMTGISTVSQVFCNQVFTSSLICVRINGKNIITTRNHLFFTDDGWVEAEKLKEGDLLYDYSNLCNLRSRVSGVPQQSYENVLQEMYKYLSIPESSGGKSFEEIKESLSGLWQRIPYLPKYEFRDLQSILLSFIQKEERTDSKAERIIQFYEEKVHLPGVSPRDDHSKIRFEENLFSRMWAGLFIFAQTRTKINCKDLCDLWAAVYGSRTRPSENLFKELQEYINSKEQPREIMPGALEKENERKQSFQESGSNQENIGNEKEERDFGYFEVPSWGEWALYQATDSFERKVGSEMCVRVRNPHSVPSKCSPLSYELQSRPCLSRNLVSNRGGWGRPSYEIWTTIRQKENPMPRESRVESVEIYKPGNNDELFRSYFSDKELSSKIVSMYDLEIEGNNSYFVEDILVHNCHQLSQAGWQAFLKVLEDAPKYTIFIFCTTDPQKIPDTILSRVQRYNFTKISLEGIVNRLNWILQQEGITDYSKESIDYIAKLSEGGMRTAISMMDKCLSIDDKLSLENVYKALGTVDYKVYFDFLMNLESLSYSTCISCIERVYNDGKDLKQFVKEFELFVLDVCKYQLVHDFQFIRIPNLPEYKQSLEDETYDEAIKVLDWCRDVNNAIKYDPNPRGVIEASILLYKGNSK